MMWLFIKLHQLPVDLSKNLSNTLIDVIRLLYMGLKEFLKHKLYFAFWCLYAYEETLILRAYTSILQDTYLSR